MKTENARTVAVLAIFAACGYLLRGFIAPICWAALLALATWPLRERLRRLPGLHHKWAAASVMTAAVVLLLLVPLVDLIFQGLREMPALLRLWSDSQDSGLPPPDWLGSLPGAGPWLLKQWETWIGQPGALSNFVHGVTRGFSFQFGRTLLVELGHRAMSLFFSVIVVFFLYLDGQRLAEQVEAVVAGLFGPVGVETMHLAARAVRGTVNGLVLVGLGVAVVMSVAYAIAGVEHPAFWGLATGLLGMVPFGAWLPLGGVLMYMVTLGALKTAIVLGIFGAALLFVADHFIRPVFIAGSSKLPVILALLGVVGGLETFGVLGLFVGPTLLAVLSAVWRQLAAYEADRQD